MIIGLMVECPTPLAPAVVQALRDAGFARDECYGIIDLHNGHSLMRGTCDESLVPVLRRINGAQIWADPSIVPAP